MALYRPWLSICGQTQEQQHEQVLFRGAFQKGISIRKSLFIYLFFAFAWWRGGRLTPHAFSVYRIALRIGLKPLSAVYF